MKVFLRFVLVVGFVGGVWVSPLTAVLRPVDEESLSAEFRRAGERPKLEADPEVLRAFPAKFDGWYRDAFGLRPKLIRAHNRLKWLALASSPTQQVIPGREGWIFSTWGEANTTWSGLTPLSRDELETWRRMLEVRAASLAERGIEYLYVLVPNKNVLYPEFMPERFERVGPTRREQFMEYVAPHVPVLDLLPALRADRARGEGATYYKLGDHWTDRGALAGAQAIVTRLKERFPALEPLSLEDCRSSPGRGPGDSWSGRLYLEDRLSQDFEFLGPIERRAEKTVDGRVVEYATGDERLPRCLIFHDSFGDNFVPLFAEHFALLGARRGPFELDVVEGFAPNVVVEMWVERILFNERPVLAGQEAQAFLEELFAASQDVRLDWTARTNTPAVDPLGGTKLLVTEEGLVAETADADDFVELPELAGQAGADAKPFVLAVELTAPERTLMHLAYRTREFSNLARERSFRILLNPGRNRVLVHVDVPDLAGRLVLRPGQKPGRYVLHGLTVRGVEREP